MGHLGGVHFQNITGTRIQHVPYRGSAPAMQDLVAGQIDMMIDAPVDIPAAAARRHGQSLCRAGKEPLGSGTGRPDGRRGWIARLLCLELVRVLGTQRHAKGDYWQAQ